VVSSPGLSVGDDLSVCHDVQFEAAALRYFDATGRFTAAVLEVLAVPMPLSLRATAVGGTDDEPQLILAWRSPTDTLMLSRDVEIFRRLQQRLSGMADGCMVEQTGGVSVLRVRGRRAGDLLLRLGAVSSIPPPGAAFGGRMAELQVLTVCLRAGEYWLLVERVYADHLLDWIGQTAADF
jgi:hypothetical protein